MTINGTTAVYGILGDPVAHSLSPRMQNAALRACGLDAVYVPFHVTPEQLPAAVAGIRALAIRGVNVTVPHKEAVLALLDEIDVDARTIGAVNTVVNRAGRLIGFNTDAPGFLQAVRDELGFDPRQRRVLLLGAGGACRAALVALARAGVAWLGVANRSRERAEALVARYRDEFPATVFAACGLTAAELQDCLPQVDLLVNTSVVGLKGESFELPLVAWLPATAAVFDMVYTAGPGNTPLVLAAHQHGMRAADGRAMLAAQGEAAFALWTGQAPPTEMMQQVLLTKDIDL